MTPVALTGIPVLTAVPQSGEWDYGGFPYGIEPLTLPEVTEAIAGGPPVYGYTQFCTGLRQLVSAPAPVTAVEPAESPAQLYWFRWVTGHQVTFILWRLVAHALSIPGPDVIHTENAVAAATRLTRGFNAMLWYSSSVPPAVYNEVIRPRMYHQHRAFSGSWAPDFAPVCRLYRGRQLPGAGPAASSLRVEVKRYRRLHRAVAARLVPDGMSLLQEASTTCDRIRPDIRAALYDNFFLTTRGEAGFAVVVAQLVRRLDAVSRDAVTNGIDVDKGEGRLRTAVDISPTLSSTQWFVDVLADVASCVTGDGADQ